ncbi:unnamed protein product [Brassica napus]|uniref:(rape) hypothetical protein n=1 Tax=Brassica napus TaxID=3708 RepID=A0A816V482_BRANA|nr:unnamed protein product [Brassica napus]
MDLIQSYDGEAVSSSPDSSPPGILKPQSSAPEIYGYAVDYYFRVELRWRRGSKTTAFLFIYISPRAREQKWRTIEKKGGA